MSIIASTLAFALIAVLGSIIINVLLQTLSSSKREPAVVFHWIPFLGNTISYGMDPYKFFLSCREKAQTHSLTVPSSLKCMYGNIYTFVLLGRKVTVYLGTEGNHFILNGKLSDVNAEEAYSSLTTPVFGSGVVYDCPNSNLMEQKKFIKFGLTQSALESYVPMIESEVLDYIKTSGKFKGNAGTVNIPDAMAQITIFTAGRTLQGDEVRAKLTAEFADLYHDLNLGFSPINFMLPWAPLPHNKKRDAAHAKMRSIYMDIINERRKAGNNSKFNMIANLSRCVYKDGNPIPDKEIAHMMITLLMAGQRSSSSISSWIMLRLASEPQVTEELYQQQITNLRSSGHTILPPLQYEHLEKPPLHRNVIKETLRPHSSIHSFMRKVKRPLPAPGTDLVIPDSHILLAFPGLTSLSEEHFPNLFKWDPHRWDDRVEAEEDKETVDYGYGVVSKGTHSPYLSFGAGRHRCIGESFAYLNLEVITATIVRKLKFCNVDDVKGVPKTDCSSLFSRPMQPAVIQ